MVDFLTKVPSKLRKIVLDFTLSCLLEKPDDYVEYGVEYFLKLRECRDKERKICFEVDEYDEDEFDMKILAKRRASVSAEHYNPEDDSESIDSIIIPKTEEERKKLTEEIKGVFIFRSLQTEELASLINAMNLRIVTKDEFIIIQGDDNACQFFVIDSGSYEAWVTDKNGISNLVKVYHDRGNFGELALMYNLPRATTIKAISDGKLWVLDRETFKKIVLRSAYLRRERYQKLFERVEFLTVLDSYAKLDLADSLISKIYENGEIIFKQGDIPDGMYFVESGGIICLVEHPLQGEVVVTELLAGDYLGELALLTHNRRAVTAKAFGNTKLAFLDKGTFERLLVPFHKSLAAFF